MGIWFVILIMVLAFLAMAFCRKWHDYALLISFAIGFSVNAHFYNSFTYPVCIDKIPFGFNAFLYVGFIYAAVLTALEYEVRRSKILTSSTVLAILMAGVIQFFANVSTKGFNWEDTKVLLFFLISGFGSFVAIFILSFILVRRTQLTKYKYVNIGVYVFISFAIHSVFFYLGAGLVYGFNEALAWNILGYYIEGIIAVILGLFMYWINTNIWIPKDLQGKYTEIWKRNK